MKSKTYAGAALELAPAFRSLRERRLARRLELDAKLEANYLAWSEGILTDDQYNYNASELRFRVVELDGGRF